MATLNIKSVRKSFGRTEVIHGIDIDIDDGEFIVIVGPSGCGKSTLLRMVAGLETITEGEIAINGERVNEHEPMERNIAMVFQNYALYPHMNVFDNMAYGLKIAGTPKNEIAERVRSAANLLQLDDFLMRKPRQLSGGQRQRVAMGRAIVRDPAVFLFDEPLSNLDAKLRVQMRLEIKALQKKLGTTALYVTHDQVEAMTLADRMIVMNEGVAEQIGAPLDVYGDPKSVFVAGFIGSPPMNFLAPGAFEENTILADRIRQLAGKNVSVGIRPEKIRLAADGLTVEVTAVDYMGAETVLRLRHQDQAILARVDGRADAKPGDRLSIQWNEADVHLFDASGVRLGVEDSVDNVAQVS